MNCSTTVNQNEKRITSVCGAFGEVYDQTEFCPYDIIRHIM